MKTILIFLTLIMVTACTDQSTSNVSTSMTVSTLITKIAEGEPFVTIRADLVGLNGTSDTDWVEIEDDTGLISAYVTKNTPGSDKIQISIEVEVDVVKSDPLDAEIIDPFGKKYKYKIIRVKKIRDFD